MSSLTRIPAPEKLFRNQLLNDPHSALSTPSVSPITWESLGIQHMNGILRERDATAELEELMDSKSQNMLFIRKRQC